MRDFVAFALLFGALGLIVVSNVVGCAVIQACIRENPAHQCIRALEGK